MSYSREEPNLQMVFQVVHLKCYETIIRQQVKFFSLVESDLHYSFFAFLSFSVLLSFSFFLSFFSFLSFCLSFFLLLSFNYFFSIILFICFVFLPVSFPLFAFLIFSLCSSGFYFIVLSQSFSSLILFRWGTHLYVTFSVRPSAHLSIAHHIPGTVHHLIIIFGTHV